jgi:hypothetical protein
MGSVVELAAWLIIVEAALRLWLKGHRDKQREIEKLAVGAEYLECEGMEYDDSETDLSRRIWARRKEELRMRYPAHLIKGPDYRYFEQARKELKTDAKEDRRDRLPTYIGVAVVLLSGLTYRYIFDGPFPAVVGPALGVVVTIFGGILIFGIVEARREWKNLGSESVSKKEKD